MEITFDFAAVRQALREEYARARAEIRDLGPVRAYERSQRRHDERLAAAGDAATLDEIERMQRNIRCPFLAAGRCSIYAARPQTCRNYHATDAAGCRQSYEAPENLDIEPEFAPLVHRAGAVHVDAFSKALQVEGYDIGAFELNGALAAALASNGEARRRFGAGLPAFPELEGGVPPFEVLEDEGDCAAILGEPQDSSG